MTTYLVDENQRRKLTGLAKKLGAYISEARGVITVSDFKSERNEAIFARQAGRFGASVAKPAVETVRPAAKAAPKAPSASMGVANPVGPPSAEEVEATLAVDRAKREAVLAEQEASLKVLKAELAAKEIEHAAKVEATIAADLAVSRALKKDLADEATSDEPTRDDEPTQSMKRVGGNPPEE
jgi:hypothetical protein